MIGKVIWWIGAIWGRYKMTRGLKNYRKLACYVIQAFLINQLFLRIFPAFPDIDIVIMQDTTDGIRTHSQRFSDFLWLIPF